MRIKGVWRWFLLLGLLWAATQNGRGSPGFDLNLQQSAGKLVLTLPSTMQTADLGLTYPEYTVERSADLENWQPVGGKLHGLSGRSGPLLNLSLDLAPGAQFYRASADPYAPAATVELGSGGEEVFGYDSQMADELDAIGSLSVAAFSNSVPQPAYLPAISFDPTTAQFWTNFAAVPAFSLNPAELTVFKTNGFVVSERLGTSSFADAYYNAFDNELPVFVTADSLLHAWHRSYCNMLEELEELQMATLLERMLTNMAASLPEAYQKYGAGPLSNSILDADYFLTVARSLWTGYQVPGSLPVAGQSQTVAKTLSAIASLALIDQFPIFGSYRDIDFSQFTVRGHYTDSARLSLYFQTMMWCGYIDLRVATFPPNQEDDIRELGTAIVMNYLLQQSGELDDWTALEQITSAFVGVTDSMTFAQLGQLLAAANITSPAAVPDLVTLTNLQTRLLTGELGVQSIPGAPFQAPLGPGQLELPRSFTVCGQKFVLDGWAFSQVVFDKVVFDNVPVMRRVPSCLDVAYSVLGNDQIVPELAARMLNTNGVPFRDGLPYQQNLLAVRQVMNSQGPAVWTNNLYNAWLAALRTLSAPTTAPQYPQAMQTPAWAMKTLSCQLASWTELKHDTVLYAKQPVTPGILCGYPAGFVEPRPEFWQQMQTLADTAARSISALRLSGSVYVSRTNLTFGETWSTTVDLATVQASQVAFTTNFSAQVAILHGIALEELAQQPLTDAETAFIQNLMEWYADYTGTRHYNGWYPLLFYRSVFGAAGTWFDEDQGSAMWDALVTDVNTDAPDVNVGDPGAVLHEGVGNVHLLLIAVDNGPDRMVYAGPVFSHYEFEEPTGTRLTDAQWKTMLTNGQKPPSPDWTQSYLVPSP